MPIFADIEIEPIVQVNDRTRLNAGKSFVTQDVAAITKVEIDPGTGSFIDLGLSSSGLADPSQWYLDYVFDSDGSKTIRSRITAGSTGTASKTMTVITEADDYLFSADSDLAQAESDILKYVEPGRNTFKNVHRAAQDEIVRYLDEKGYTDSNGDPLTKAAVVDLNEVRLWSKFTALRMIFEDLINSSDDVFSKKTKRYEGLEQVHRNKALLRLDLDGDGEAENNEGVSIQTGNLVRR